MDRAAVGFCALASITALNKLGCVELHFRKDVFSSHQVICSASSPMTCHYGGVVVGNNFIDLSSWDQNSVIDQNSSMVPNTRVLALKKGSVEPLDGRPSKHQATRFLQKRGWEHSKHLGWRKRGSSTGGNKKQQQQKQAGRGHLQQCLLSRVCINFQGQTCLSRKANEPVV